MTAGQEAAAPSIGPRTESVYRALLSGIREGRYEVNSRLPSEYDLANLFAVSRPVVRNALALLRREGVVQSVQGSGTRVIANPARPAPEAGSAPTGGSVRDLQRCFEFRVLVEGEAAHLAALRHTPRSLERIAGALYPDPEPMPAVPEFAVHTFDFHRAVVDAADSVFLSQSLDLIVGSRGFGVYLRRGDRGTMGDLAQVHAEHIEIFRLIERRQASEAREAMRGHIQRAYDRFMECIPVVRT